MRRNEKGQVVAKKFKYPPTGEMLTQAQIADLRPDLGLDLIRTRMNKHPGNWEKILAPKQVIKRMLDIPCMGKRMDVEDIPSPTDYEVKLWGK